MTLAITPARSPALELHGVTKRFGDVTALSNVSITVEAGHVHALLGENGAGKTTLMRIAYGLVAPESGTVTLFGSQYRHLTVREATRVGVGMVQQHLSLVPALTTAENLVLGGTGLFDARAAVDRLRRVAAASGLAVPSDALAGELSIVEQQRLETLKALAREARLLILDEPTAVLAPAEVDDLLGWIRNFARAGGSVVLITHKLRDALAVADAVTVLRRGRVVHAGRAADIEERQLAHAMFPEMPASVSGGIGSPPADVVVEARDLRGVDASTHRGVHGVSLQLHRHEIVGIAAVEGSGHREMLLALAGRLRPSAGAINLPPSIAFIPADRGRDAIVAEFSLTENVALRDVGRRRGLMPWRDLQSLTSELMSAFGIVASSPQAPARTLSGGNQQRLVVARELKDAVDLVVADNPTRGLDMQSTEFVHQRLRDAAARGAAVVVHSSDLDEVLGLATRVLVVFRGEVREVGHDRDTVGRAMLGAA